MHPHPLALAAAPAPPAVDLHHAPSMIDRRRRAERMARLEQELANSNERRRAARLTELEARGSARTGPIR
eukprot:scaffold265_cov118-Isochrysis_galbana.AAC.3